MTDKEFRTAALEQARRRPEDVDLPPHAGVQRCEGGAFCELSIFVPDEKALDSRIAPVRD